MWSSASRGAASVFGRVARLFLSLVLACGTLHAAAVPSAYAAEPLLFEHFAPDGWSSFADPTSVTVDDEGFVWVADYSGHAVYRLDGHGNLVSTLGTPGASGSSTGVFNRPWGVAVAPAADRVYVTDNSNRRVQVFTRSGEFVSAFGSLGTADGQFNNPTGIAVSDDGEVYVADTGNRRVQVFDGEGVFQRKWATTTPTGAQPYDVAFASGGDVLVVDGTSLLNARVQRFTPVGSAVATYAVNAGLGQPRGITVGADGTILVADYLSGSRKVHRLSSDGSYVDSWPAPNANDVAYGADGNILVVNRLDKQVTVWNRAGDGAQLLQTFPTATTAPGAFSKPRGISIDDLGFLYVADSANNRIQKLLPDGGFLASADMWGASALSTPTAIALEPGGTFLVSDGGNRIHRYTRDLVYLQTLTGADLGSVGGIAVTDAGRVFVVDGLKNCVHELEPNGTSVRRWPSDDEPGTGEGDFANPGGVTVTAGGAVWVADTGNRRLQRFSLDGQFLSAASANVISGGFVSPTDVAIGRDGSVWVADAGKHRVNRLSAEGADLGEYYGSLGVGPNRFNAPAGIAIGPASEVYVADTGNSRLMRAVPPVVTDTTPPVIQVGDIPAGWANSPVSISLSALDEGSVPCEVLYSLDGSVPSIASTGAVTISVEGTTTLRYSSRDTAGNEATGSAIVRIDRTGPVISHNAPDGWVDTAVDLSLAAVDALNDVARIEYRYLPDGEWVEGTDLLVTGDGTHRIEVRATDTAGNQSASIIELRINTSGIRVYTDATVEWTSAELVELRLWSDPEAAVYWGWGEDDLVNLYTAPIEVTEEGVTTVGFAAERPSGSLTARNDVSVYIDRTPPTVSDDAPDGVVRGPVTVTFGSDDGSGSGVVYTQYRVNGGDWQYDDSVVIVAEGATFIEFRAVDGVGLSSALGSCNVVIDNTPPTVSHEAPAGWVKGSAVVTLTADEGSILYSTDGSSPTKEYTTPLTISSQGSTLVRYRGKDAAGNLSAIRDVRVYVDNVGPVLTSNTMPAYEGTATVTLFASDGHSGLKQVRHRVNGGEWQASGVSPMVLDPISAVGTYTVEYDAVDELDNASSGQATFVVREPAVPDTAPPVTRVSGFRESWSSVPVTITLSAEDESEVQTLYRLGDRPEALYVGPIPVSQDGETVFRFYSVDSENNVEDERQVTVRIDKGAPGTPGAAFVDGLSATSANIVWGPSQDPVSGVSHYVVTDETGRSLTTGQPSSHFSGLAPGSAKTFTIRAVDFAGNVSAPASLSVTLPASEVSAPVASGAPAVQVRLPVEVLAGEGRLGTATVTLEGVTRAGYLTLSRFATPPAAAPVSKRVFGPGVLLAFDGECTGRRAVTMPYDPRIPSKRGGALTVMARSGGQWQAVQSWVDTVNHTISFYPSSFGTFWVMEPVTTNTNAVFSAPQTIKVAYGVSARITARLTDANGEALVGYRVALERSSGAGWVRVGSMYPVTGTPGAYTLTQRPYRGSATTYRTVLEATGLYNASPVSTKVIPKAKLTRPRTPTTGLRRYKAFYTTGTMAPAHRAPVKLYFERYSSGRWRVQKFVTVTASSTGGYRARTSLKAGKWRVRATHLDAGHLATTSTWSRTFTVR